MARDAAGAGACQYQSLWHDLQSGATTGVGVQVRGGAFAGWTLDPHGISLWLDLRCGGAAVRPGDRIIDAAVIREVTGSESPFAVYRGLCATLCPDPLPTGPLVGDDNWYYAYGRGFGSSAVLRDAPGQQPDLHRVRFHPCGRSPSSTNGGASMAWPTADPARAAPGTPAKTKVSRPRHADTAAAIAELGVRPGIWFRPLLSRPLRPRIQQVGTPTV